MIFNACSLSSDAQEYGMCIYAKQNICSKIAIDIFLVG